MRVKMLVLGDRNGAEPHQEHSLGQKWASWKSISLVGNPWTKTKKISYRCDLTDSDHSMSLKIKGPVRLEKDKGTYQYGIDLTNLTLGPIVPRIPDSLV